MNKKNLYTILISMFLPIIVFANDLTFRQFVLNIYNEFVASISYLFIAAAALFFAYGIFVFMRSDDQKKKEVAKSRLLWGIIALFVMVSIWGIINILRYTFDLGDEDMRREQIYQEFKDMEFRVP